MPSELDALRAERPADTVAAACDALLDQFVERAAPQLRRASEAVYEDLLYMVQDYLRHNAHWNLANDIERCERTQRENIALRAERDRMREALREIASVLGIVDPADGRHARHNLVGAAIDTDEGRYDAICKKTFKRVEGQLADVENIIARAALGDAP